MKQLISFVLVVVFAGCASVERNAYIATGSATTAVELARQAYIDHANTCHCVTESEFDRVRTVYEKYQLAAKAMQTAITEYKRADAPNRSALEAAIAIASASAADVITLVQSLLPPPEAEKLKTKLPKVNP
jgi:glycerol-3-phosphate O-acyltransferase